MKILVIDDNPAVLEVTGLMLTAEGHTVLTAEGGADGLARLAAEGPIDLVLTDLRMPELTGVDVVRAVRRQWPAVRVGILSGSLEGFELALAPGEVDVIVTKPMTFESLHEALAGLERTGHRPALAFDAH
jgi:CheY-like chemotaxis protein